MGEEEDNGDAWSSSPGEVPLATIAPSERTARVVTLEEEGRRNARQATNDHS